MKQLQLIIAASLIAAGCAFTAASAEISSPTAITQTPETAYLQYTTAIHKAVKPTDLPAFSHSSPLNKIKLADSRYEEKEIMNALKEMTPHSVKFEGKVEFGNHTYIFFEGDPELAAKNKEYFPVTVEMIKEEGKWKLRRQQSWHVKHGSDEEGIIPKGAARVKRFQELMSALTKPIPMQGVRGSIGNTTFHGTGAYFYPRDGYFKLTFTDGVKDFSVYIRESATLGDLQGRKYQITPLDGYQCDLLPDQEIFAPYCAKIEFGKVTKHGYLPGTISLAARVPQTVNLIGVFNAVESDDAMAPEAPVK